MQRLTAFLLIPAISHASCPDWDTNTAKKNIERLHEEIQHHNDLYFIHHTPTLTDDEFDALVKQLQNLSTCFPTIKRPSTQINDDDQRLKHIKHKAFMGSLKKADHEAEVNAFLQRLTSHGDHSTVVLQPKVDGIATELVYQNGRLIAASTRGNGHQGRNILSKIQRIPSIPNSIPGTFPVVVLHGELFTRLDRWNAQTPSKGRYSSARHFVAGLMSSHSPDSDALSMLDFYPWRWIDSPFNSEQETIEPLKAFGFQWPATFTWSVSELDDIRTRRATLHQQQKTLPFLLDGIVLKANSQTLQTQLGWSGNVPNWAMAWKFPPESAVARVTAIVFKTGRTGVITPIVEFTPVQLNQTTITSVSLNSVSHLESHNIAIGDQIAVQLKGAATPVFHRVVLRTSERKRVALPDTSQFTPFSCLSLTQGCDDQFIARLQWLVKRLNLTGLDTSHLQTLVEQKRIHSLADLLTLSRQQLENAGIEKEQAETMYTAISQAGRVPFDQQIRALSIPDIGASRSRKLAKTFRDWNSLLNASDQQLSAVAGVSQSAVKQLRQFLNEAQNQTLIQQIHSAQNDHKKRLD